MKRTLRRGSYGVFMLVFAGILTGCATERSARFGMINENERPQLVSENEMPRGGSTLDFTFTDSSGQKRTFSEARGVVTAVVFPESSSWPECTRCQKLEELASRVARSRTPVTVMSIVTPPQQCADVRAEFAECGVKGYSQLLALCDDQTRIHELFGADVTGKFFVVDSYSDIVASGRLTEMDKLEQAIRKAVEPHEEYVWSEEVRD